MADEYDYDVDDMMDFDDGWIYVEDEFGLAVGLCHCLGSVQLAFQSAGTNSWPMRSSFVTHLEVQYAD